MTQPPWTYSQLDSYESCPRKFFHLKVLRDVVEPPTVHTDWGTAVHTAFENAILNGTPLPTGMTQWQGIADKFANLPGQKFAEYKFSIDKNFQPMEWSGSWSRGIADYLAVNGKKAVVADWKTGKRKPSEQLALYAAYTFHFFPEVDTVQTGFVWLREKKITRDTYTRDGVAGIWGGLLPRARKLESAYQRDVWPAKPSGLCKNYCPVLSCQHNGRRGK